MEADGSAKKIFHSEQTVWCMYVWGCMNFLSTKYQRLLVDLERLLAAGK